MSSLRIVFISMVSLTGLAFAEQSKIGVILPMSGDFARYGEQIRSGIDSSPLATRGLVYEDEGCDPRKTVTAYRKLTDLDRVRYILGPWCGSPQTAVAPLLSQQKQLAVLGASAPRATFELSKGRMLSSMPPCEDESEFNAKQINALGLKRAVIIFFENQFSRAHEAGFRSAFAGEVLETIAYTSSDSGTLKGIATRIKQLKPDVLYLPDAFPLMSGLVGEIHRVGLGSIPKYSVYSAQSDDVLKAMGIAGEGLIYSYPDIGDRSALDYFPRLAVEMLHGALSACSDDTECALKWLKLKYTFTRYGAVQSGFVLKTIRDGKFVVKDERTTGAKEDRRDSIGASYL